MAEDSKIHTGHRRRMRSRVAENGFSSLEPHEALECLLYITNARKNTNRMAHELIDRFGDFAGVLDASEEDLMTVEGVGPATARMLHLMPDVCRYYTQCRTGRNGCLKTTEQLACLPGPCRSAPFCWRWTAAAGSGRRSGSRTAPATG